MFNFFRKSKEKKEKIAKEKLIHENTCIEYFKRLSLDKREAVAEFYDNSISAYRNKCSAERYLIAKHPDINFKLAVKGLITLQRRY